MAAKDETRSYKNTFGRMLRSVRVARGLAQDYFDRGAERGTTRVYISGLERSKHSPSLDTVELLAHKLELHPVTMLMLSYLDQPSDVKIQELCDLVRAQCKELGVKEFSKTTLPPGIKAQEMLKNLSALSRSDNKTD